MALALGRLAQEDPSFRVKSDEGLVKLLSLEGELHLEILVDRMKREFNVDANIGKPQVAIGRLSKNLLKLRENLLNNPVVKVNMVMFGSNLNLKIKVRGLSLLMPLRVVLFQKNTFLL